MNPLILIKIYFTAKEEKQILPKLQNMISQIHYKIYLVTTNLKVLIQGHLYLKILYNKANFLKIKEMAFYHNKINKNKLWEIHIQIKIFNKIHLRMILIQLKKKKMFQIIIKMKPKLIHLKGE